MRISFPCKENNCDYDNYYILQAGGAYNQNEITYYSGQPFQRGYNIFTRFGKRYAVPFLKKLGKKALDLGSGVLRDIFGGLNLKLL
jgi:hypothetical protein